MRRPADRMRPLHELGHRQDARLFEPRSNDLQDDRQIVATHRRFVKAMEGRIPAMGLESKERYFAVLSNLVTKLETADKPMREIMQEMMSEAAALILQELQR